MILWSPMPLEVVLAGFGAEARHRVERPIPGGWLIADMEPGGKAVINRLITTDPQAYLEPGWRPGSVLREGIGPADAPSVAGEPEAGWGGSPGS
jgi:hypothetical protein